MEIEKEIKFISPATHIPIDMRDYNEIQLTVSPMFVLNTNHVKVDVARQFTRS